MTPPDESDAQVIERLIDHYERSHTLLELQPVFTTTRGDRLPVGLKLYANYKRERVEAVVTADGILCEGHYQDHPSSAAVEVKIRRGLSVKSAQSNGWLFWHYHNASNRGVVLETLRRKNV